MGLESKLNTVRSFGVLVGRELLFRIQEFPAHIQILTDRELRRGHAYIQRPFGVSAIQAKSGAEQIIAESGLELGRFNREVVDLLDEREYIRNPNYHAGDKVLTLSSRRYARLADFFRKAGTLEPTT